MGTEARAHFFSFKMGNAQSVIEIQHRFGAVYSEMAIQGMPNPDEVQARVLMTHPSDARRKVEGRCSKRGRMPGMKLNMEKRIMLDGEKAETVDSVDEAISISNNNNNP